MYKGSIYVCHRDKLRDNRFTIRLTVHSHSLSATLPVCLPTSIPLKATIALIPVYCYKDFLFFKFYPTHYEKDEKGEDSSHLPIDGKTHSSHQSWEFHQLIQILSFIWVNIKSKTTTKREATPIQLVIHPTYPQLPGHLFLSGEWKGQFPNSFLHE